MKNLRNTIKVGKNLIGETFPPYVIAEAGVAHFGNFQTALDLLNMSVKAGANAFKLQVFDVDETFSSGQNEWKNRLRDRVLTLDQIKKLRSRCTNFGLDFILTFHDSSLLSWVDELQIDAIKVGSGEKGNAPFLDKIGSLGLPVILSTGMCDLDDVKKSVDALVLGGCKEIALLHCVTSYPAPFESLNLKAITTLKKNFSCPIGYSDHTDGDLASIVATSLGANLIEKHITIQKGVVNAQDWKVSCDPSNFDDFVKKIKDTHITLGNGIKKMSASEESATKWALKRIVASEDLNIGHQLQKKDLAFKRAPNGLSPDDYVRVIGKVTKNFIHADQAITYNDLE